MSNIADEECKDQSVEFCFGNFNANLTYVFPHYNGGKGGTVSVEKHRLIHKSEVFKAQFASSLDTNERIVITDTSLETFKDMIHHIYGFDVEINKGNFLEILYISRKYFINDLTHEVLKFLEDFLEWYNLPVYFEAIEKFSIKMINDRMRNLCSVRPFDLIVKLTLSTPHKRILKMILEASVLCDITEYELYQAIVGLLKREFRKMRKPFIDEDFRNELGQMIYLIRFPSMSLAELVACARKPTLLKAEELIDFQLWVKERIFSDTLQFYSITPRSSNASFVGDTLVPRIAVETSD